MQTHLTAIEIEDPNLARNRFQAAQQKKFQPTLFIKKQYQKTIADLLASKRKLETFGGYNSKQLWQRFNEVVADEKDKPRFCCSCWALLIGKSVIARHKRNGCFLLKRRQATCEEEFFYLLDHNKLLITAKVKGSAARILTYPSFNIDNNVFNDFAPLDINKAFIQNESNSDDVNMDEDDPLCLAYPKTSIFELMNELEKEENNRYQTLEKSSKEKLAEIERSFDETAAQIIAEENQKDQELTDQVDMHFSTIRSLIDERISEKNKKIEDIISAKANLTNHVNKLLLGNISESKYIPSEVRSSSPIFKNLKEKYMEIEEH